MQQSVELITIIVLHIYGHDDARVEIMTTVLLFCVCLLFFPFLCRLGLWDCLSLFFLEVVAVVHGVVCVDVVSNKFS
jgi:hypothetical protein